MQIRNSSDFFFDYPFLAAGYFTNLGADQESKRVEGGVVTTNMGNIGMITHYDSKSGMGKILFNENVRVHYIELVDLGIEFDKIIFKNLA